MYLAISQQQSYQGFFNNYVYYDFETLVSDFLTVLY